METPVQHHVELRGKSPAASRGRYRKGASAPSNGWCVWSRREPPARHMPVVMLHAGTWGRPWLCRDQIRIALGSLRLKGSTRERKQGRGRVSGGKVEGGMQKKRIVSSWVRLMGPTGHKREDGSNKVGNKAALSQKAEGEKPRGKVRRVTHVDPNE